MKKTLYLALPSLAAFLPLAGAVHVDSVVSGDVSLRQDGSSCTIHASDKSIIHYSSFNVDAHESVQFIQPSANATVLNRVVAGDASHILGRLQANGRVYLVNPNGIFLGDKAVVQASSFFAIAGRYLDQDYLQGIERFTDLSGRVTHLGRIEAEQVALLGRYIESKGSIIAKEGDVAIVSAEGVAIVAGGGLIVKNFSLTGDECGIDQSGVIESGKIHLAACDVYRLAIKQSGKLKAQKITLNSGGAVHITGEMDASSRDVGGKIEVFGGVIDIRQARLHACGDNGGGEILIGGGLQGKGSEPHAKRVFVDAQTHIASDALVKGDGGVVVVWSDERTQVEAFVTAKGAANGLGGLVETSSLGGLQIQKAMVDTASGGDNGVWLLDPLNIVISNSGSDSTEVAFTDGCLDGLCDDIQIDVAAINDATSDVVLQAQGSITADVDIQKSVIGFSITMQAGGSIALQEVSTNGGYLTLQAGISGYAGSNSGATIIVSDITTTPATGSAGFVDLSAPGTIDVGNIEASASLDLGAASGGVSLFSSQGSVVVGSVRARGGTNGQAGDIEISCSLATRQVGNIPQAQAPLGTITFFDRSQAVITLDATAESGDAFGSIFLNPNGRSVVPCYAGIATSLENTGFEVYGASFQIGKSESMTILAQSVFGTSFAQFNDLTVAGNFFVNCNEWAVVARTSPAYVFDLSDNLQSLARTQVGSCNGDFIADVAPVFIAPQTSPGAFLNGQTADVTNDTPYLFYSGTLTMPGQQNFSLQKVLPLPPSSLVVNGTVYSPPFSPALLVSAIYEQSAAWQAYIAEESESSEEDEDEGEGNDEGSGCGYYFDTCIGMFE